MLPRIGKTGGQQRPSSSAGRKTASAGRNGHTRATVAVTDSEDSSFGESDDSPVKSTRARTVSAGKYQTPSRGVPRRDDHEPGLGMSRQQRESESRGEWVDRSRVEHDRTKPVVTKEQVFSMRNPAVDVSDSTGEDSEGDSMGKRALQQARNSRSKSRDRRGKSASRARTRGGDDEDENLGQVRTKYGVKVKVDKVDMDKYADFDHMVRAQTRDGRRATKDEDNRRTQQSAFATQVQREAMELQVEEELQELDDIASKRERWLLRNQERQLRAAEASKRQLSLKGVGLARMWLSQIRRPGPETWSPRAEVPGAGEEDYGGGSHDNLDMTRREDTGRQKLYHQSQLEIELYKKEISALADREDEQRRILKELWSQKAALQAKDEKYTQIVWEVRKHILEQKDELEKLTRRKGDAEHQLDMVYNEMEAFRAEGEVVQNRRMAALDEIGRMKEERAAQEEVEKEQLALLLRMRCVSVSLSLSLFHARFLSFSLFHSLSRSHARARALSLSIALSRPLSLALAFSLPRSLSLSRARALSLSLLCLSHSALSLSSRVARALSLCLSLSFYFACSLSLFLSLSRALSLSHALSFCISLSLPLSLSLCRFLSLVARYFPPVNPRPRSRAFLLDARTSSYLEV